LKIKKECCGNIVSEKKIYEKLIFETRLLWTYDLLRQPTGPVEIIWVRIIPKKVQYPGNR